MLKQCTAHSALLEQDAGMRLLQARQKSQTKLDLMIVATTINIQIFRKRI